MCVASGGDGGSRTPVQNKLTGRVYTFSSLIALAGYTHEEQSAQPAIFLVLSEIRKRLSRSVPALTFTHPAGRGVVNVLPILGSKRGRSGERRSADVFGSYAGAPLTRLGGSTCSNSGSYPVKTKHPHS